MKKLLLPLLLLLTCQAYPQTIRNLFNEETLKGKVKFIVEVTCKYSNKNDTTKQDTLEKHLTEFDKTGNLITTQLYLPFGRFEKHILLAREYKYNTYRTNANLKQVDTYHKYKTSITKLDSNSVLNEIDYYDKKGKTIGKAIFKHDAQNHQTEHTQLNEKGTPDFSNRFSYANHQLAVLEHYDKKGALEYKQLYTYIDFDEAGNWTKRNFQHIKNGKTDYRTETREYIYYP